MAQQANIKGHRLIQVGMPGSPDWRCECGCWEKKLPAVGPYGRTTHKAKIAQLVMAHRKHAIYAP